MKSLILIAALSAVSGEAFAQVSTTVDVAKDRSTGLCSVRAPEESTQRNPSLGMTKQDLQRFSATSEVNMKWVQWYLGTQKVDEALKLDPKESVLMRIKKWNKCEETERFAAALNNSIFSTPRLECVGGDYTYRFRFVGKDVELELLQKRTVPQLGPRGRSEEEAQRVLVKEQVRFVTTTQPGCATRITQAEPDGKNLKICLRANSTSMASEGRVQMAIAGRDIPEDARQLSCKALPGFHESLALAAVPEEQALITQPAANRPVQTRQGISVQPAPTNRVRVSR